MSPEEYMQGVAAGYFPRHDKGGCEIRETICAERPAVPHYDHGKVQPIDLIRSQNLNFLEGNVVKYVCRYRFKGGKADLLKARDYLNWLIEGAS